MRGDIEGSKSGSDPGPVFLERPDKRGGFFLAVRSVGFVGDLFPSFGIAIFLCFDESRTELGFFQGKGESKSAIEKVFDAAHAGVAGFDDADLERQMADKWNVLLFGFFGNREKGIAGGHGYDFYEIG